VHVLVATDATWVLDDIVASLGGPDTSFTVCREGRAVEGVLEDRTDENGEDLPDIAILDLQIGSMGGMAVTMDLRLDESSGRFPHIPVLMLLDRSTDVHLARRSGAEGWMIKPLDPLRLRRAVAAVLAGEPYREGLVAPAEPDPEPEGEPAPTG
jgi:CheY-like chemotaxis protein